MKLGAYANRLLSISQSRWSELTSSAEEEARLGWRRNYGGKSSPSLDLSLAAAARKSLFQFYELTLH